MRMIFYVSGSKRKGTAHMDLKKVLITRTPWVLVVGDSACVSVRVSVCLTVFCAE